MIGIARIILVGVNNELSVNDLELNFFHTEKVIIAARTFNRKLALFFVCVKLGKWLSLLVVFFML